MNKLFIKTTGIIKFALLALYLFVLYELLIIPAILDWSVYGVLLALVIAGLLIYAVPPGSRRNIFVLSLLFLLSIKAIANLEFLPWYARIAGYLTISIVLFIVGRIVGRVRLGSFLTVFLVALSVNLTISLNEVPLWTEFSLKWRSPVLYRTGGTVDYFPLQAADITGDNQAEIITQGNLQAVYKERENIWDEGEENVLLRPENNSYLVYQWNGRDFSRLRDGAYSPERLLEVLSPDYLNFPYYSPEWKLSGKSAGTSLEQLLPPLVDRKKVVDSTLRFGEAPFFNLALNLKSITLRQQAWNQLFNNTGPEPKKREDRAEKAPQSSLRIEKPFQLSAGIYGTELKGSFAGQQFEIPTESTAILGAGRIIKGQEAQLVLLGKSLQVLSVSPEGKTRLVNEITSDLVPDIGTAEAFLADVDYDGLDELLLNTEHAKILELEANGSWRVLWASRDDSFRFEGFASLGADTKPLIIALAKSNVRQNRTRYMTGYEFTPEGLTQKWRVFSGMINLQAADVDGDGQNELAGYLYKKHVVMVLEKHRLPVVPALYGLTLALIGSGLLFQMRYGRSAKGSVDND